MDIKRQIELDCEKNVNEERCGFVVQNEDYFDLIYCENRAEDPVNNFYIPAKDFLHIKTNHKIVGVYHSHIKGTEEPSEFDKKTADLICYPFIIYAIENNKFNIHIPEMSDADPDYLEKLKKELL